MEVAQKLQDDNSEVKDILDIICGQMIKTRPESDVALRPYIKYPFVHKWLRGSVHINLGELYTEAKVGDYAYIAVNLKCQTDAEVNLSVAGTDGFWLNGVFEENAAEPIGNFHMFTRHDVRLKEGDNEVIFKCRAYEDGFGLNYNVCHMFYPGIWTCDYLLWVRDTVPVPEFEGEQGFAITELVGADENKTYADCTLKYPLPTSEDSVIDFMPIYGGQTGDYAVAVSYAKTDGCLDIKAENTEVYINGVLCCGDLSVKQNDEIAVVCKRDEKWGFVCESNDILHLPIIKTKRASGMHWLLLGAFDTGDLPGIALDRVYHNADGGSEYWRFAQENTYLRPYLDTSFFGQWFYGLMVGEYGLLRASKHNKKYYDYFEKSMRVLVDYYEYMQHDARLFEDTPFLKRSVRKDDLDSIGTIGMNLCELYMRETDDEVKDRIFGILQELSDSVFKNIPRMEDGTFYRVKTMWADDTYMSCPFLVRMGNITGDKMYYDEVCRQLISYTNRLFMESEGVFAHIYFPEKECNNAVPWGRGNGWVYLAFAETIEHLPEDYARRDELIEIFKRAVRGLVKLQDESGMWHQVLNMEKSYCETSCTGIFSIAIAKGIRLGILERNEYLPIIYKAVEGLLKNSVDDCGNVLGVCRGSGSNDDPEYYARLETVDNDDHGTGVVIAAICEILEIG